MNLQTCLGITADDWLVDVTYRRKRGGAMLHKVVGVSAHVSEDRAEEIARWSLARRGWMPEFVSLRGRRRTKAQVTSPRKHPVLSSYCTRDA